MEFLILGPLEVRDGQRTVHLGAAKQRALLGVLLLNANATVSTSRLVDELWGERPPATAEKLVQGYVHALRKQLGEGVVETRAPGYSLRVEAGSLDLLDFEHLTDAAMAAPAAHSVELRRRALALWRGPPLADVVLEGPERHKLARLAEQRLATQIERIDAELQLGRHAQLIGELEALVAERPYQERAAGLLMLALYRSGRQADALEVYRTVRGRLSDELGLQPGQELRDLEAAILRQDSALDAFPSPPPQGAAGEPELAGDAPSVAAPRAPEARGRRLAIAGLPAALAAAAAIVAGALLFRGEPGSVTVSANSIAVIDAETNRVTATFPTGNRPGSVAAGDGFVWAGNLDDKSLTRIDTASDDVVDVPLGVTPHALTVGRGALWVVSGRLGTLYRVDPESRIVAEPVSLGPRSVRSETAGADVGEGSVWAGYGDSTLAQVDPETLAADGISSIVPRPTAVVVGFGSVWVAGSDATVYQFSPETYDAGPLDSPTTVGRAPSGLVVGDGAIWVACRDDDFVERIPPDLGSESSRQIPVGDGPTALAFGAGAIWVANTGDGTVSRIDTQTYDVTTIDLGNAPAGIAFSGGRVWVSIQAPFTP
jgi:YVTN family beta-propeller protein